MLSRCSRLRLERLLRYLRALPTIRVHPELDGRTLDIVYFLTSRWRSGSAKRVRDKQNGFLTGEMSGENVTVTVKVFYKYQ